MSAALAASAPDWRVATSAELEQRRRRVAAAWLARSPDFEFELDWPADDPRIAEAEWSRGLDDEGATRAAQDAYERQLWGRS